MLERSWWIQLVVLYIFFLSLGQSADICPRGKRLYTPFKGADVCLWCDDKTFMPEEKHKHRKCYPCTTIQNLQLERLAVPCNRTHDTEIHCIDGYYRTQPSYPEVRGHCQPCTKCHFPKRPCQTYHDTLCCGRDDSEIYINKEGHPVCVLECGPGHFLDPVNHLCIPCPQNSYMTDSKHINIHCKICAIPKSQKEKIVRPCNATHPTVIDCVDGYSRQFSDMEQADHGDCVKICGRGHFLEPATETCQPCHQNTFMDEDRHNNAYRCKTCATPKTGNEKIVQSCNSTHPAVIGCVEGFHRRLSDNLATSTCAPCRNCSENTDGNVYEGRACDELSNSVCCPQPGMAVIEACDGPICIFLPTKLEGSPVCGEGEYLYTSASGHSVICLPCPQGTYMDKVQHISTSCKSCTECPNKLYCDYSRERHSEGGLAVGTIIGLVLGLIFLVIVIQIVVYCALKYWWRRRKSKTRGDDDSETHIPLLKRKESETARQIGRTMSRNSFSGIWMSKFKYKEFISVAKFTNVCLPYQYCDDIMVQLVKLQAELTTLINVTGSSDRRPKLIKSTDNPYPYSEDRYRNEPHTGSGWVQGIEMYTGRSCPCETCSTSDKPVKQWGEVVICTATRVVFDITEARNCQCYFFYEKDDTDMQSCPCLSRAVKILNDIKTDWCYMTFVTHDFQLIQKLHKMFTRYHRLRRDVQHKYQIVSNDTTYRDLTDEMFTLHDNIQHSLNLLEKKMEELQKNPDNLFKSDQSRVVTDYSHKLQDHSSCLGDLLELTTANQENDNKSQKLLKMLSTLHRNYSHCLEHIVNVKRQLQQNNVEDEDLVLDKYRELWGKENELNRFLRRLMLSLRNLSDAASLTECPEYEPRYNSEHDLTIIISHPKGRSQQISLGEVTDRKSYWYDHHSIYRYTNKTCEGCEGARVFILGRTGLSDHSHSGIVGQEGESGAWSDIIPYIVNLSVIPKEN